jgi:inner membrane transporter RhtA
VIVLPAAMILTGIVSVQLGARLADKVFGTIPPAAVTGLRLWISALAVVALSGRGFARSVRDLKERRAFGDAAIVGGRAIFRPAVLATGAAIGMLSSVIPYRLELESLRRMPTRLFGVWMSLEPAVAALIGLVMLRQRLSAVEWIAIGCVMIACAGAAQPALP